MISMEKGTLFRWKNLLFFDAKFCCFLARNFRQKMRSFLGRNFD